MLAPFVVVAVGCAVLMGTALADRLRLPASVMLVLIGALLAAIPELDGVGLPSSTVLFVFLPMLLYWESLSTSMREIRRYARAITLNSTLLVAATAAAVAVILHLLGVTWPTAWLVGAALAPTDATAVASLGETLPRNNATVLQAESMINDGTALVVFTLALSLTTGHAAVTAGHVTQLVILSFGGGALVGLLCGWAIWQVRRRMRHRELLNLASVLTPFIAYLAAESIGASGVLAVVVCGLYMAQVTPKAVAARTRVQGQAFWTLTTFTLNGSLFVLVGLALPKAAQHLAPIPVPRAVVLVIATFATLVLVRYLFVQLSVLLIRALDRRPQQRELRTSARYRVVHALAGLRGGVSLAMALSVPASISGSGATPGRHLVVFVTAAVVVLTLVVQGLLLPVAIRWAHLAPDDAVADEARLASGRAVDAALEALPALAHELQIKPDVADRVKDELTRHRDTVTADDDDDDLLTTATQYRELRLALMAIRRETIVALRDEGIIDDIVLRDLQTRLDLEEVRIDSLPASS